ncbi:MAG: DNA polymerase/3'-5' exonuclease PolX, partial [Sphingobacteriales bacterium]
HKVVIELNAHPRRLYIDWRFIPRATQAGVFMSLNPDAHYIEGFDDVRYGVLAAQKGGLTAKQNLSSFSRAEFEKFIKERNQSIQ